MSGYAKLSSSIVFSTVWREPHTTRIVWITLLALADAEGYVGASLPGLADAAHVTLAECEGALACFLAPDPYSRSKEHDGRRIEVASGGWSILNYRAYRDGHDHEARRRQNREAKRRQRKREREREVPPPAPPPEEDTEAEAEAVMPSLTTADGHADRLTHADTGGDGSEDLDRDTICPLDLAQRLEANGTVERLAEHCRASRADVAECLRHFVSTWTIGKLAGQKRRAWAARARQWVLDQNTQGRLQGLGRHSIVQNAAEPVSQEQLALTAKAHAPPEATGERVQRDLKLVKAGVGRG